MNPAWPQLFTPPEFGFQFGLKPGSGPDFFGASAERERLLSEREKWLHQAPTLYAADTEASAALLAESVALLKQWKAIDDDMDIQSCEQLGRILEPDFILLQTDAELGAVLRGGSVCFPSSWRLTDKIGLGIGAIHEPVPGLNAQLGPMISRYLQGMKPGIVRLRSNWGMSRVPDLNQHPVRELPQLDATVQAHEIFVRIENQALLALPESGGLLFGIRLEVIPLTEVISFPKAAAGLRQQLLTMPLEVARYKQLEHCRELIAAWLKD
ncbi:MAG: hypothetical protein ACJASX_000077 [Limisphaerales bacterium]|jgi:hypothetical protein